MATIVNRRAFLDQEQKAICLAWTMSRLALVQASQNMVVELGLWDNEGCEL